MNFFSLIPHSGAEDSSFYDRIFGDKKINVLSVEAKGSLQKAIQDHVREGGTWRTAVGVVLPPLSSKKKSNWRLR